MTFTDFCEKILIALYQDGHQSDEWLSFAELQTRFGLSADTSWLSRAMNHLSAQRRIEGREVAGAPDSVVGRITGSGMAYIEGKYGSKDGMEELLTPVPSSAHKDAYLVDRDGANLTDTNNAYLTNKDHQPQDEQATTVASSTWTGLPSKYEMTEARRSSLSRAIAQAESDLDALGATNMEKAQARAYILAVRALSDAPEPPTEIIWSLLNRAAAVASLASLFMPLLQAFLQ